MLLAVCHISDIHISTGQDPVLSRAKAIVAAVAPRISAGTAVLLVCTGDIAYAGEAGQYRAAEGFFGEARDGLERISGAKYLGAVLVPGNHDCDFSVAGDARPVLISAVGQNIAKADLGGESLRDLLKVQSDFFQFAARIGGVGGTSFGNEVGWTIRCADGPQRVLVRALNTAILSQLHESPGQLQFPLQAVPDVKADADFCLTIFHHPYPWLAPDNRRELQRVVESISDLILTGHEHDGASYVRSTSEGETDYVEGAALQSEGDTGFNLIVVDLDKNTNQISRFRWNGEMYEPTDIYPSARVFTRKRSLIESRFELQPAFSRRLNDAGTGFSHPNGDDLTLESIFVYPDIKVARLSSEARSLVQGEDVLAYVAVREYVHIAGPPLCGKSTLARALFIDLRRRFGLVPVLLNGSDIKASSKDEFQKVVERALGNQYQVSSPERFRQLERTRKVLLIDDWHRCRLLAKFKAKIMEAGRELFGRVVVFSDDVSLYRLFIDGPSDPASAEAGICEIQQFGFRMRTDIIRKWHNFGAEPEVDDLELASRVARSEHVLDSLVGKGVVPSWPIFILSVLQAESSVDEPAAYGSYGHLYEALLTRRLARSSKEKKSLGQKYTILSMLAYELFKLEKSSLTEEEVRAVHTKYELDYQTAVDREHLLSELEDAQVWVRVGSDFQFRYKYAYYFFVAKYFQQGIGNVQDAPTLRAQLSHMVSCVHDEDYANLLIFYIYLSKDRELIQQMLGVAERIYSNKQPARLAEDVEFLDKLRSEPPNIFLAAGTMDERRDKHRSLMDEAEASRGGEPAIVPRTEYADDVSDALKIDFAFKSLQVMGQVLKNFPLDLKGDLKVALTKESYQLTLRTLRVFLELLEANISEILLAFESSVKVFRPFSERDSGKALEESKAFLVKLAELVIYGMIKKLSLAVGAVELKQTYHEVRRIAGESNMPTRLIDLSIELDHFARIPVSDVRDLEHQLRKSITAYTILRLLVADFLNLFPCDYKTHQKMVELFKFKPHLGQLAEKKVKKLPS